jgi:hypothetical protein
VVREALRGAGADSHRATVVSFQPDSAGANPPRIASFACIGDSRRGNVDGKKQEERLEAADGRGRTKSKRPGSPTACTLRSVRTATRQNPVFLPKFCEPRRAQSTQRGLRPQPNPKKPQIAQIDLSAGAVSADFLGEAKRKRQGTAWRLLAFFLLLLFLHLRKSAQSAVSLILLRGRTYCPSRWKACQENKM